MVVGNNPRDTLEIYVAPGCAGCETAFRLADRLRQYHPGQPVRIIDLADYEGPLPAGLVGTPTYRLGEEIISLGNPSWEELMSHLDIRVR